MYQLIILLCHLFLFKSDIFLLVMNLTIHNKIQLTIQKTCLPIHDVNLDLLGLSMF